MDSYSDLLNAINSGPYFGPRSRVKVTRAENGEAEGELEICADTRNPMGIVHGGALFTLADSVAGTAAFTTGRTCVTLDSSMQFLAAAKGDKVYCTARPKKLGRTIVVYDVTLVDSQDRLVASGVFSFFTKDMEVEGLKG